MKVILAERTGFCFGVKRAVNMAEAALRKGGSICSLGSIIHNAEVVRDLSGKGLKLAPDLKGIGRGYGAVVISSHGIGPKLAARIRRRGLEIIDTTCPFVLKAQRIAAGVGGKGFRAVIVGDADHPEVKALVDFAPKGAVVVKDAKEASRLRFGPEARICVISQTTQSTANFLEAIEALAAKRPGELKVYNTICNDAEERQRLARDLASRVDAMLVIGGANSANTRRLYQVCRKVLRNSHLIETEGGLRGAWLKNVRTVGIASGASTPDWAVKRVVEQIKKCRKIK